MKYFYLLLLSSFLTLALNAQNTYTEKLRKNEAEQGMVVINQSEDIDRIVNNQIPNKNTTSKPKQQPAENMNHHTNADAGKQDTTSKEGQPQSNPKTHVARSRHKAKGYRICIFMGGNSRADKTKAIKMGRRCREEFGELAVYTSFVPPRWVTNVGDFRTRQDAQKYVNLIRHAGFTYLVRVVPSEVNLPD